MELLVLVTTMIMDDRSISYESSKLLIWAPEIIIKNKMFKRIQKNLPLLNPTDVTPISRLLSIIDKFVFRLGVVSQNRSPTAIGVNISMLSVVVSINSRIREKFICMW